MLPNSSSFSRTVFINPNFKTTTHINPNFIKKKPSTTIHVNPNFLDKIKENHSNCNANILQQKAEFLSLQPETKQQAKIIEKSKTKLVRVGQKSRTVPLILTKTALTSAATIRSPLIKIGLRKLVRASTTVPPAIPPTKHSISNKLSLNLNSKGKYKIDRRIRTNSINGVIKKKSFVTQFALNRDANDLLNSKKLLSTSKKILNNASKSSSVNKKLELLSINGVLYKSTRNKLQRSDTNSSRATTNKPFTSKISTGERVLFVRGNKFVLDKTGLKLTKVPAGVENKFSNQRTKLGRIDVGGLTYIAKSNNVFVRTDIHKTRNHLSVAKQKSINVLSNRLVKSNLPCQIYRKLGKCAAFERGKCPKLHEKMHVAICAQFLKGECVNKNCLLSHNITLSKMPVCKFFLQGCCVREDCPYLHKKLSQKAEICLDFLKGFCSLADKCDKRHEFLCPDFESKGKCEKVKCIYCRKKTKFNKIPTTKIENNVANVESELIKPKINEKDKILVEKTRYFIDDIDNTLNTNKNIMIDDKIQCDNDEDTSDEEVIENVTRSRPKLGDLPAFIPL